MRRQRDTIDGGRPWLDLLGVSALILLSGCGWFGGDTPSNSQKVRPGVDRQTPATGSLPPAGAGQQHDPGIAASDPTANAQVGSIIPAKGGQKAQKDAVEKENAERDAKEREERQRREAEERDAKAKEPVEPAARPQATPGLPGKPPAAEPGNTGSTGAPTGSTPANPAPVSSEPIAPPRT